MSIDAATGTGLAAALVVGLGTGVHCAGMCGPLACSLTLCRGAAGREPLVTLAYQGTRLASYAAIGGVAGAVGQVPLAMVEGTPLRYWPWLMVAVLVAVGLGADRLVPRVPAFSRWLLYLRSASGALGPVRRAAVVGAGTPLLPCGPLYLMLAGALASGSAVRGAQTMLVFALGTLPLLWVAGQGMAALRHRIGGRGLVFVQRSFALVAAAVIGWRIHTGVHCCDF